MTGLSTAIRLILIRFANLLQYIVDICQIYLFHVCGVCLCQNCKFAMRKTSKKRQKRPLSPPRTTGTDPNDVSLICIDRCILYLNSQPARTVTFEYCMSLKIRKNKFLTKFRIFFRVQLCPSFHDISNSKQTHIRSTIICNKI